MKIQHTQQDRRYDPQVKKRKYVQLLPSYDLLPYILGNFQMSYSESLTATRDRQPFQGRRGDRRPGLTSTARAQVQVGPRVPCPTSAYLPSLSLPPFRRPSTLGEPGLCHVWGDGLPLNLWPLPFLLTRPQRLLGLVHLAPDPALQALWAVWHQWA